MTASNASGDGRRNRNADRKGFASQTDAVSSLTPEADEELVTRKGLMIAAAACLAVIVSHIFGRSTYSLLLPAISDELVSSYGAAGFLGASYFGGYLLGVIGVTVFSSRIEPIVLMRTGLAISVLALATMATAQRFSVFSSGIFFVGLAGAGIWIPAPTIASSRVPARYRGLVIGALTATMGIGLLGLSQGTKLYRHLAGNDQLWREIFGIEVAVTTAILVFVVAVVRRDGVRDRLAAAVPTSSLPNGASSAWFSLEEVKSIPHWVRLTLAYTVFALLAGAWVQFLGVVLSDDAGFSQGHIANLFSVLAVAAIIGPLSLGQLSDRIGRDRAMAIAATMSAVASLLLPLDREPFTSVAVFLYGAGSFAFPPLTAAAVRDHLEGSRFSRAFGTMTILYAIISMIASQAAGLLADATGDFDLVYLLLAAAAFGSVAAALSRQRALG